jgi:hypothetical protein
MADPTRPPQPGPAEPPSPRPEDEGVDGRIVVIALGLVAVLFVALTFAGG